MKKTAFLLLLTTCLLYKAYSFCGFYVAKADVSLFNKTSQVILVRDGNRNVITMSSDFSGDVKDFAMVVPVPQVLRKDQIKVVERVIFDKLDAYSAPRLVEYYDQNPCSMMLYGNISSQVAKSKKLERASAPAEEKEEGVRIEAKYTVGEYDILILSAEESGGLEHWLIRNGYKIPSGAREVLEPYIKSQLKFFVVKVNMKAFEQNGFNVLRPIQIQFESPKFMLPIRLGMANAASSQDMIVYAFTRQGRVETANYRTVKVPTDRNVPEFVQNRFGEFYKDLYTTSWKREGKNIVFLEYSWNLSSSTFVKCDPCPVQPPAASDLADAGVFWLQQNAYGYSGDVFMTRLHLTYDRSGFPQDLMFIETPNKENFQGRYIITHPAPGPYDCSEANNYLYGLQQRREKELQQLAHLTGWNLSSYSGYATQYSGYIRKKEGNKNSVDLVSWMPERPPFGGGGKAILPLSLLIALFSFLLFRRFASVHSWKM